jgi:replicative DNA helicase
MNHKPRDFDALFAQAPPMDPDSETALLSAVILDPTNLDKVADLVCGADFGNPDHGRLFDALTLFHGAGLPISDIHVLMPELKRANVPEDARDRAFLYQFWRRVQRTTPTRFTTPSR